ncbi:MAG: phospho-N-acetylmuramoyl-pentapeptide-transferase [Massiliimalia sp.]|jgi:phospho-N-acetylmuramoyl-pentapeptide-transferase
MGHFFYQFLSPTAVAVIGVLITFGFTFLLLRHPFPFLPKDQGRKYAVNGALSKGKTRGVGLVFMIPFTICSLLFLPWSWEYLVYLLLMIGMMLSGYLDDASDKPWSEYKKGLIDFILSAAAVFTFLNFNSTEIFIGPFAVTLPSWLFAVLGIILFWASVNVTNCSDGVDGLCASLCTVSLFSFVLIFSSVLEQYTVAALFLAAVLLAYLYFNCSPSSMLMGDAGSRALGFFLAVMALKSGHPFIFLLLAAVMIVDGGSGLVKIFLKRFLKISVLVNTKTPIHDHMRKNKGWSDTQVVTRFVIIQVVLAAVAYLIVC